MLRVCLDKMLEEYWAFGHLISSRYRGYYGVAAEDCLPNVLFHKWLPLTHNEAC